MKEDIGDKMRCPRCRRELISGEFKKYEDLNDHVSNPNATDYPLRITYVCPKKCLKGFYDAWGDYYSSGSEFTEGRHLHALDSGSRRSAVDFTVRKYGCKGRHFFRYLKDIYALHIDGEKDIPENIAKLFMYYLNSKIRYFKSEFYSFRLSTGINKYAWEKDYSLIKRIKERIKRSRS
jgi:hypothetical protein